MSEPSSAIVVKDLSVELGRYTILDNISFSVPRGQTTAIIGPNGAGKSVLIKAILRLLPKKSGEVHIFGVPHEQYRKIAPRISFIPQRLEIDQNFPLTVRDLFALKSARPIGYYPNDEKRMQNLLTLVGLEGHQHQRVNRLSGGQLQRLLVGYSLMDNPQLICMDEPSAGIDVQGQETIYSLIKRIQEQRQLTVVLVSHELEIVLSYAQQVLCLNKKLLCAGIPREVLSHELLEQMYGMPVGHFTHHHPSP
jgi:ABC-type Mn2+/Zn2+ transport system ATPase subunit